MRPDYYNVFHTPTKFDKSVKFNVTWAGHYHCGQGYYCYRKHGRNDYMLLYTIDGEGWYKDANGKSSLVEAGSILFFRPNEYQNIKIGSKIPWVIYGMHFHGEFLDSVAEGYLLSEKGKNLYPVGMNNNLITLFEDLIKEIALCDQGNNVVIMGLTLQILGETDKALHKNMNSNQSKYFISEKINKAIQYMNLNYNKKLSLGEIASETGYSVSRFIYLFKEHYNTSPIEYLLNIRIERAKKIIGMTNQSVAEIGYSVGFNDPLYFSKAFKERVGISPKIYKNSLDEQK